MKHKPIKPRLVGCLTCSPVPPAVLPRTRRIKYGWLVLECDGELVKFWSDGKSPSPKVIERLYREQIAKAEWVTLGIWTYMHYEVYELNKDDGKWYLVKQGIPD